MKRRVLACVLLVAVLLTGCGTKVSCDFCGEEKAGKVSEFLGEEVELCNDCLESLRTGM